MKSLHVGLIVLAVLFAVLSGATVAAAAGSYTCTNGAISAGMYQSVTITGNCSIPSGTVLVRGGVTIMPGASLNAASPGTTVTILGNVSVGNGGSFILGCSPSLDCGGSPTNDLVDGNVRADHPLELILHGNTVHGSISMQGGGGSVPFPVYSAFENNKISGSVFVSGYQAFWLGFLRNDVHGSVTFDNNTLVDPDAVEIASNTVDGNLVCFGNSNAILGEGTPNTVTGRKTGHCAGL